MNTDTAINAAIDLLRENGFAVTRPEWGDWITPGDLHAKYLHLPRTTFHKRMKAFPGDFMKDCGPTGRLIRLRPSQELLAWLERLPTPTNPTDR